MSEPIALRIGSWGRSAAVIQQRHAQYLKDGIEFDAIEALENLRDELGLSR